ncbi:MAG TPA: GNAT family N-acetyltransferase [Oscillospiraceae bacterium]|jgi:predicted acetyltransferase|nr:GNAT family N-acetyltransferase [Oscillospiraceae bacterium]
MEVRKIKPEEHMEVLKLRSVSYNSKKDFSDPEKVKKDYEAVRALFDENGKACATTRIEPLTVRFNGHNVKMGGIGAVATLPQERNKGHIRRLLKYAFEEMRENNQIFSYLFPFSFPYYRMFAYECNYDRQYVNIPLNAFTHLKAEGRAELFEFDKHIEDLMGIYEAYIEDKNLAVVRDKDAYKSLFDRDPYSELFSTYIWYNPQDEPVAYIAYDSSPQGPNEMNVMEFAFKNYEGAKALLGFLSVFHPTFTAFKGAFSLDIDFSLILADLALAKRELTHYGMNKIIDVEKVLGLLSFKKDFDFVIKVEDDSLEWNNDNFSVSFKSGKASVERVSDKPDIACDVRVLTRFVVGYTSLRQEYEYGNAEVFDKADDLFELFGKKKLFMTEGY